MSLPEVLLKPGCGDAPALRRAAICGLGSSLPDVIVGNAAIAQAIGVEEGWIERRTGIRHRRHAPDGLTLTALAAASAQAALQDAGLPGSEIDLVLLATISQEHPVPNLAPQVATAVGAEGVAAFDLGGACTGFVAGLATAAAFIESGRARNVLLVGADALSRQLDHRDKATAALFGDGAGAVVLTAAQSGGIAETELASDGSAAPLIVSAPATGLIQMDGHETFKAAVTSMEQITRSILARAQLDRDDVDLYVFHQANARITRSLAERLGLPAEKVVDCIAELGNTSGASVPLALDHARTEGRLHDGDRVLVCAAGAGFMWGAALLHWGRP